MLASAPVRYLPCSLVMIAAQGKQIKLNCSRCFAVADNKANCAIEHEDNYFIGVEHLPPCTAFSLKSKS